MSKLSPDTPDQEIIENLHLETAKIEWVELQRFFASGKVLLVDASEDLLKVATALVKDDAELVGKWVDAEVVKSPSNEQAQTWFDNKAVLWALVLNPWVLVQELSDEEVSSAKDDA